MTVFSRADKWILYVHVPKTGGTSIEGAFESSGWKLSYREGFGRKGEANWYRRCSPQHMHADQLEQVFRLDRFDGIFMTVREPIARFQSEYLHRHRRREAIPLDAASVEAWAFARLAEYRRDPWMLDNHLRPQSEFHLPGIPVFRLEDGLDAAVQDVSRVFGVEGPQTVERLNLGETLTGGVSSRDVEISPRLRDTLNVWYARDFEQFGYERH